MRGSGASGSFKLPTAYVAPRRGRRRTARGSGAAPPLGRARPARGAAGRRAAGVRRRRRGAPSGVRGAGCGVGGSAGGRPLRCPSARLRGGRSTWRLVVRLPRVVLRVGLLPRRLVALALRRAHQLEQQARQRDGQRDHEDGRKRRVLLLHVRRAGQRRRRRWRRSFGLRGRLLLLRSFGLRGRLLLLLPRRRFCTLRLPSFARGEARWRELRLRLLRLRGRSDAVRAGLALAPACPRSTAGRRELARQPEARLLVLQAGYQC